MTDPIQRLRAKLAACAGDTESISITRADAKELLTACELVARDAAWKDRALRAFVDEVEDLAANSIGVIGMREDPDIVTKWSEILPGGIAGEWRGAGKDDPDRCPAKMFHVKHQRTRRIRSASLPHAPGRYR